MKRVKVVIVGFCSDMYVFIIMWLFMPVTDMYMTAGRF